MDRDFNLSMHLQKSQNIIKYLGAHFILDSCKPIDASLNFILSKLLIKCEGYIGGSRGGDSGSQNHKHLGFISNTGLEP